jgi:hypothetical protein
LVSDVVMPGMNGRKIRPATHKAFLRELRSATSFAFVVSLRTLYWELRDTGHVMEASANHQVTALSPVKSFRQIVFLMLDAFALFQQGPKIKKCAGYEI